MLGENGEHIKKAIESAQHERTRLIERLKEFDEIRLRISQLEAFINQGQVLIGETPKTGQIPLLEMPHPVTLIEKPLVKGAMEILREFGGGAMKLTDLAEEFYKRGWKLSKANGAEVLRSTLKKNPDMFIRVMQGKSIAYALNQIT